MKTVIFIIGLVILAPARCTTPCTAAQIATGCRTCVDLTCTECLPNYKKNGYNAQCGMCQEGEWTPDYNTLTTCNYCSWGAERCSGIHVTDITFCYAGFFRQTGIGCARCPEGKSSPKRTGATGYETIDICTLDCSYGAAACRGTAGTEVEFCKAGFFKRYDGCVRCPIGKTRTPLTGPSSEEADIVCTLDCPLGASACKGTNAADATHCKGGLYLSSTGCTVCPPGKGKAPHSLTGPYPSVETEAACDITCGPGIANCKSTAANEGHWCLANYWWFAGVCTACPDGMYKLAGTGEPTIPETMASCQKCTNGASRCTGPTGRDATHCMAGYFKNSNGCNICPNGTGKPAHDVAAASPASENESSCTACPDIKNLPAGSLSSNTASCLSNSKNNNSSTASLMQSLTAVLLVVISMM